MKRFLAIAKALSDPSRVRILLALAGGELCVCQILELLSLAPSTVSRHLALLYQAGLVEMRKEGRWVLYRLPDEADPMVAESLDWARRALMRDDVVRDDRKRLRQIRKLDLGELCQRQGRS